MFDFDDDFVDQMCEYDLYYNTFKDDSNDPFVRPPKKKQDLSELTEAERQRNIKVNRIGCLIGVLCVVYVVLGLIFLR